MLDGNHQLELTGLLKSLEDRIQLPDEWRDFFSQSGPLPTRSDERRRFTRHRFRIRGVLEIGQSLPAIERYAVRHCIYLRDLSRTGVSFVHAEELFPGERCLLWTPKHKLPATIVRCRRRGPNCFVIGASLQAADS